MFVIFIGGGILLGYIPLETLSIKSFLMSLLGITPFLNLEWWYIFQYIIMLLFVPFILLFIEVLKRIHISKKSLFVISLFLVCISCLLSNYPTNGLITRLYNEFMGLERLLYLIIFSEGFLCKSYNLFTSNREVENYKNNKIYILLDFSVIVALLIIRFLNQESASYMKIDIFITAPFVYFTACLLDEIPTLKVHFGEIGKHSTYIWLTHTFFCYYYFSRFIYFTGSAVVAFLVVFFTSLLTAEVLESFEHYLKSTVKELLKLKNYEN